VHIESLRDRNARRDIIKYWSVVAIWMAVISMMSGEGFSAENTNRYLDPILRYLFPKITPAGFILAHSVIRKTAHFVEFFVLGLLAYWAARRDRAPRWRAAWAAQAMIVAITYALLDEAHQMFVPNRTGSIVDSLIDSSGALASQICLYAYLHRPGPRVPATRPPS